MSNSNLDQYYEILGLNPGASPGDVKQAYRNLVKIWHPDSFTAASLQKQMAEEKFKQITEAYQHLRFYQPNSPNEASNEVQPAPSPIDRTPSRPYSNKLLLVIGANVAAIVVLVFVALNYSRHQTTSSHQTTTTPEVSPSPEVTPIPQTDSAPLQPEQCCIISPTVGKNVRVFSQPSKDTFTGKRIPKGTKVSFMEEENGFLQVQLPDKSQGWVFNDQIHPCNTYLEKCSVISPTVGESARIFSRPSKNTDTGKRIPRETKVAFIIGGQQNEFAQIRLSDKGLGWVFNDQIKPCTLLEECRVVSPTVGESARIFSQPSKNADTGKRIPKDTKVSFIGGEKNEFAERHWSSKG